MVLKLSEKYPKLRTIVIMDSITSELYDSAKEKNIEIHTFGQIEINGSEKVVEPTKPKPSDVATIIYTSGTLPIHPFRYHKLKYT